MNAQKITPSARHPPANESFRVGTEALPEKRYKRLIPQTLANLCLEIAIALIFPLASPLMLTRRDIDAAKKYVQLRDAMHIRAVYVLCRIPEIFSYDTESIYGLTRFINWNSEENQTALRQLALTWLSVNGIHERQREIRKTRTEEMTHQKNDASRFPSRPANTSDYRQQLTLAALQGLCANPAYCGNYEDLPDMAIWLAGSVISRENHCEQ